ncbi:unnamed protein product [Withania somnifera]
MFSWELRHNWSFRPCRRPRPCISQERNGLFLRKNKNFTSSVGYTRIPLTEISCVPSAATQNKLPPLVSALKASVEENAASFHFPGHNRGQAVPSSLIQLIGTKPFLHDLPEHPELDNLFSPEALETWFLVGGSTCGIQAAIMATCSPGDTLILLRTSHISAISSMVLPGALPKYIVPEYDFKWDVAGGVTPSQVNDTIKELEGNGRKAAALLVVSLPICQICHSYNIPVIVDEAHGAHLGFHPELPSSSLSQGADLSPIMLQSSSPSYLLFASLDAARAQLSQNREAIFDKAIDLALEARNLISKIPGISVLEFPNFSSSFHMDPLQLTFGAWQLGLSGFEADDILCNDFSVVCDLVGTKSFTLAFNLGIKEIMSQNVNHFACLDDVRISRSPREAFFATKRKVSIRDSLGEICGELVCPYPPGIPMLIPDRSKGAVITGAADCSLSSIVVCVT